MHKMIRRVIHMGSMIHIRRPGLIAGSQNIGETTQPLLSNTPNTSEWLKDFSESAILVCSERSGRPMQAETEII
jgi:hypothetical protein